MNTKLPSILLVEDNKDHAELVMRCFEDHNIQNNVFHVSDGEVALNYLFGQNQYSDRAKYPVPNLILLDLRLPKIDGIEVLCRVKSSESLKKIPVVILTSSENEKDLIKAYDNYVNSYVVKPLDFDKYLDLTDKLGLYWLDWNKAPKDEH